MSNASDFIIENGILTKYTGPGGDVVIPEGVTSIGEKAFSFCSSLISVMIPKSVTSIGRLAFSNCNSLTDITIPKSVISIGRGAFSVCSTLTSVTIPEGVTNIEDHTFEYCDSLTSVTIPNSVTSVGGWAFQVCPNLISITIGCWIKGFEEVLCRTRHLGEDLSFAIHTTSSITEIPAKMRKYALLGFAQENPVDISSERSKSYLSYAKRNAEKLIDYSFEHPDLLFFLCEKQLIQAKTFDSYMVKAETGGDIEKKALLLDYMNKLGSQTVENAREKRRKQNEKSEELLVERSASYDPMKGIEGLTFVLDGLPNWWATRNELKTFFLDHGAVLASTITKETDYYVTGDIEGQSEKAKKAQRLGVQVITKEDFNDMVGRRFKDNEHIKIPAWVKKIGDRAFCDCNSLSSVSVDEGSTAYKIENGLLLTADGKTLIVCPRKAAEIKIPDGVVIIEKYAFKSCKDLSNIVIPDGVTSLEEWAFYECSNLKHISIPGSVTKIGLLAIPFSSTTIYAPKGSYAAKFAKKNNIPFVAE